MVESIVEQAKLQDKNILILGAPRSGTHALASVMYQLDPSLQYLGEIAMLQQSDTPWKKFEIFYDNTPRKLAHIVQGYGKIFAVSKTPKIKQQTIIVSLRRKDKIKQFASWQYFKKIGSIYNFDHNKLDYIEPGSLTVTMQDIESFIFDQLIDTAYNPDYILYYEDLSFEKSNIAKNQYCYPIEKIFSNIDLVREHLENWKYND